VPEEGGIVWYHRNKQFPTWASTKRVTRPSNLSSRAGKAVGTRRRTSTFGGLMRGLGLRFSGTTSGS